MSCLVGTSVPLIFYLFSDLVNSFVGSMEELTKMLDDLIIRFAILGAVTFCIAYIQMFCLQLSAKLQAKRIRGLLYSVRFDFKVISGHQLLMNYLSYVWPYLSLVGRQLTHFYLIISAHLSNSSIDKYNCNIDIDQYIDN